MGGRQAQGSAASGHPHHHRQYSDQFLVESTAAGGSSTWLQSQQVGSDSRASPISTPGTDGVRRMCSVVRSFLTILSFLWWDLC